MVRIRIFKTEKKIYGYVIEDTYDRIQKRSKNNIIYKLSDKEISMYQKNKLSLNDILKKIGV